MCDTLDTHGRSYDSIHYRGSLGKIANTRSLIKILASAGLASPVPRTCELEAGLPGQGQGRRQGQGQCQGPGQAQGLRQEQPWQQQGRRKAGKGQRRRDPFQLALRNRFQGN